MKTIETERLILRPFEDGDFEAVHSYACIVENVRYMDWGPNDEAATRTFIAFAISKAAETPCTNYQYAAVLKSSGKMIGACCLILSNAETGVLGWILHKNYWQQGFGTEMGARLLAYAFTELNLHRVTAYCDTENYGSFRVMERIGMRREGCFIQARPGDKCSGKKYGDEYRYAILHSEWEQMLSKRLTLVFPTLAHKELALAFRQEFFDNGEPVIHGDNGLDHAQSYEQWLAKVEDAVTNGSRAFVPATLYFAFVDEKLVGTIDIRHALNDYLLRIGGHIGYSVAPSARRKGYASEMLRLALEKSKTLGIEKALVTCDKPNTGSARTIQKNGGILENEVLDENGETIQRYWIEIR